jgi:hypothetical protein
MAETVVTQGQLRKPAWRWTAIATAMAQAWSKARSLAQAAIDTIKGEDKCKDEES